MIPKRPVSTIMTHHVISLNNGDSLVKANQLFKQHNIRHIPVVRGEVLLGILSASDLARINFDDTLNKKSEIAKDEQSELFKVEDVMTKKITCVNTSHTIREVAEIFSKKEFHALPVVDNNQLVGFVTTTDLINYMLKHF